MKEDLKQQVIQGLREDIPVLIGLKQKADLEGGYVFAGKDHVRTGKEFGICGTAFSVRCTASSIKAEVYATEEEAMKLGFDPYLVHEGDHSPIYLSAKKASEYFAEEIASAESLLTTLEKGVLQ